MENKSGIGDWLFLGFMLTLIVGYFGYENQAAIMQWVTTMQAPVEATGAPSGGLVGFLTQYWGVTALLVALLIWQLKSRLSRQTTDVDGQAIDYTSPGWINVKLVE